MSVPAPKIFESDTLTADQRFEAVVRLEEPDRVPLSLMLYHFAPGYAGVPMSRYMTEPDCYQQAMQRVWEELGPWDLYYNINPVSRLTYSYVMMMRVLWPGRELAEDEMAKIDERTYMEAEDYQRVLNLPGWAADLLYRVEMLPRFCQEAEGLTRTPLLAKVLASALRHVTLWRREFPWWRRQGTAVQIGYQAEMPFDTLSQARNVIQFSMDLLRDPERIRRAANHLSPSFANLAILIARLTGVPRVQCYCHRSSNSFISPQQFETLVLPSMEIVLHRLIEAGLTPILHCDGDWLKNLPAMRRLPAGKIVMQLDGLTDIVRAKEVIGDRICLFGDVPAAKLATGSPAEVEAYCHRLIEKVGRGGGFILAGGCEIPPNAKPENLRAMVRAVRRYGVYETGGAERAAA